MGLTIELYKDSYKEIWNQFVSNSKNGHFMFLRKYMEYHEPIFKDYSLMIFEKSGKLIAILPANLDGDTLYSHQGLTFGGLVVSTKATTEKISEYFTEIINFLRQKDGIKKLIYKRIPDFYCKSPSQEDLYVLFRLNAKLLRRDVTSTIDLRNSIKYSSGTKANIKLANKSELNIRNVNDFGDYWHLLESVLEQSHGVRPVHSLEEIQSLKLKFPNQIQCFAIYDNDKILAGTVIYVTDEVAHTQYLATNESGRKVGALTFLIDHLIKNQFKELSFFDFGISTINNGTEINTGLIFQKESFGARTFVHDFYEILIS